MKKVGIVLLVLVLLGGYAWWRVRTPPVVGDDFARQAPAEQERRRGEARKLKTQFEELATAAREGKRQPFTLDISQEQLNTLLQDNIRAENAPVKDLRAGISQDGLAVQGEIKYEGFNAVVTMNGNIVVESGKLKYGIDSLQIGGLPAPKSLRRKAEDQMTERVNKYLARTPGTIESVDVQDGKLVIRGITN